MAEKEKQGEAVHLTAEEASDYLGVRWKIPISHWTLIDYRRAHRRSPDLGPRYVRIAGRVLYTPEALDAWVRDSLVA